MPSSPNSLPESRPRRDRVAAWLFRRRGEVAVLPIAVALIAARPNLPGVVVGIVLMALGEGLRLWAAGHLGPAVRSRTPQAAALVTSGPYAHTRHPLYLANFLLTVGYGTTTGAGWPWYPVLVGGLYGLVYRGHARREEAVLGAAFPDAHRAYREAVPGWGWRLRGAGLPGPGPGPAEFRGRALRVEAWTLHAELWLLALLWLRSRFFPGA